MRKPLFVRTFAPGEQQQLQEALNASDAFTLRRAQYLLASHRGLKPQEIALTYGGCQQTVRNVIRAFHTEGLDCLTPKSCRPHTSQPLLGDPQLARIEPLLHQSPRAFGQSRSTWTLSLLAQVSYEQGITAHLVSGETIRRGLKHRGIGWKRAKHWISSPDPAYARKKSGVSVSSASPSPTRTGC